MAAEDTHLAGIAASHHIHQVVGCIRRQDAAVQAVALAGLQAHMAAAVSAAVALGPLQVLAAAVFRHIQQANVSSHIQKTTTQAWKVLILEEA